MSGGRASVALKRGKRFGKQAGDISAVDPMGDALISAFYIECRFYKNLDLTAFVFNRGGKLLNFWHEVVEKAFAIQQRPILIARQNLYPTLMLMPAGQVGDLARDGTPEPLLRSFQPITTDVLLFDDLIASTIHPHWRTPV